MSIIYLLLLSQILHVLASDENVSEEIERVEIGDNCKTTYFENGTKLIEITPQVNMIFDLNSEAIIFLECIFRKGIHLLFLKTWN